MICIIICSKNNLSTFHFFLMQELKMSVLNNLKNNVIVSKYLSWLEYSNACRALNGLDDYTLADIGIVRGQIPEFVSEKMVSNTNIQNENAA